LCRIDRKRTQTKIVDSRWYSERLVTDAWGFDSHGSGNQPDGTGTILMVLLLMVGADHSPDGADGADGWC
jgi:hypothetical protein